MKKLLTYNRIVFNTGTLFTKFWMITMPILVLFMLFGDPTLSGSESLVSDLEVTWPFVVFLVGGFLGFYPFRNYIMVSRKLKNSKLEDESYKAVLKEYKRLTE